LSEWLMGPRGGRRYSSQVVVLDDDATSTSVEYVIRHEWTTKKRKSKHEMAL